MDSAVEFLITEEMLEFMYPEEHCALQHYRIHLCSGKKEGKKEEEEEKEVIAA